MVAGKDIQVVIFFTKLSLLSMKIIAFGASYSSTSINKQFATFATTYFAGNEIEVLDLNNYPLPVFTVDMEKKGFPTPVQQFIDKIAEGDFIIISMAEHNGSYTAAFKNLFDWASRVKAKIFEGKKLMLLSTSDGRRGAMSVLETAKTRFPFHGAEIIGSFSLPQFYNNFNPESGIVNAELKEVFEKVIEEVKEKLL